jgi:hypothetical protein
VLAHQAGEPLLLRIFSIIATDAFRPVVLWGIIVVASKLDLYHCMVSQLPLAFPREEYGHTAVPASELHLGGPDAISAKCHKNSLIA